MNGLISLCEIENWVGSRSGWSRAGLAFSCGGVSVLSMAPFFAWPVLFFTFPVLVWLIDSNASISGAVVAPGRLLSERLRLAWRSFRDGWWFGFGYFVFGLFWVGEAFLVEAEKFAWLLPLAVTLLPAGLALFFAAAAFVSHQFWTKGVSRLFVLSVAFGAAEWLRGNILTGLPWNTLGYALTQPLPVMQLVSLVGVTGLTFVVVMLAVSPLVLASEAAREKQPVRSALVGGVCTIVFLIFAYAYGSIRMASSDTENVPNVQLRLVQPAIAQKDKWAPAKRSDIFFGLLELSKTNAEGQTDDLKNTTHVIWPEAAIPFLVLRTPTALKEIAKMLPENAQLLTGALRYGQGVTSATPADQREVFNSLMVLNSDGLLVGMSDKTHLVPFGEYLPFRTLLNAIGLRRLTKLRGSFSAGKTPRALVGVAGLPPVAALICYEAIFPEEIVQTGERPGVLLNVTNDAWFGDLTGPRQHFHQNRIRAVEQGVPLVRVANNGISAVVDPYGRLSGVLALNQRGTVDVKLPRALSQTLYGALGDWLALAIALFLSACAWATRANKAVPS